MNGECDRQTTNASVNEIPDCMLPSSKVRLSNKVFQIIKAEDCGRPAPNEFCSELYARKDDDELDDENQYQTQQASQQAQNKSNIKNKSKIRQLYLELYDDKKMYKAFEYEFIAQFNFDNCYPGAKLSLTGEIDYSFDVLLLRPQNVSALGPIRQESIQ